MEGAYAGNWGAKNTGIDMGITGEFSEQTPASPVNVWSSGRQLITLTSQPLLATSPGDSKTNKNEFN